MILWCALFVVLTELRRLIMQSFIDFNIMINQQMTMAGTDAGQQTMYRAGAAAAASEKMSR